MLPVSLAHDAITWTIVGFDRDELDCPYKPDVQKKIDIPDLKVY